MPFPLTCISSCRTHTQSAWYLWHHQISLQNCTWTHCYDAPSTLVQISLTSMCLKGHSCIWEVGGVKSLNTEGSCLQFTKTPHHRNSFTQVPQPQSESPRVFLWSSSLLSSDFQTLKGNRLNLLLQIEGTKHMHIEKPFLRVPHLPGDAFLRLPYGSLVSTGLWH